MPGKMKTLLACPMTSGPALVDDRLEGRAGGHDRPALGPADGLGRRALDLRGGIAQRQDDRPLDVPGHLPHDRLAERARLGRRADQHRGPDLANDFQQVVLGVLAKP